MKVAVKDVSYVLESVLENYDVKHKVVAAFKKYAQYPERFIGAHPYNPPHLIPLVEISRGEKTSEAVMREVAELVTRGVCTLEDADKAVTCGGRCDHRKPPSRDRKYG